MKIHEYGSRENPTILLIHGFQCPWQIWEPYAEYFRDRYHVLVPILPGHDPREPEEFISFDKNAEDIESFCRNIGKPEILGIYAISMGGVQAAVLMDRKQLQIKKLIMESSPLLPFNRAMAWLMTRMYLNLTHKTRQRDEKTLKNARAFMGETNYPKFLELLDQMTDTTLKAYLAQVYPYQIPENLDFSHTKLWYFYGGKLQEKPFKKVAKYLQKHYPEAVTGCFPGMGHCEGIIKDPASRFRDLEQIFQED